MEGIQIGRIAHYIQYENEEHMAAIIVKVLDSLTGTVNLHVFSSGLNADMQDSWIIEKVKYSTFENNNQGTWHWPERT